MSKRYIKPTMGITYIQMETPFCIGINSHATVKSENIDAKQTDFMEDADPGQWKSSASIWDYDEEEDNDR